MRKTELLAPAGDLKRVQVALRYGADAVYCGGKELSLRARAGNLTIDEIREACHMAKEKGARIYITANMIPHDEDLGKVEEYLINLQDAGVSGIIVSSLSILQACKKAAPGMECHISTQQTSCNSAAVRYWKSLGADRVVLARECTFREIEAIQKQQITDLEVFIHGAMCTNYSGRCLLSNEMTDRDANRGGCAQSCRWKYEVFKDGASEGMISLGAYDLNGAKWLSKLLETGVRSLKIEGRMKTEFYIASVVRAYRYLMDQWETNGTISSADLAVFRHILGHIQNRPCADGFMGGIPGREQLLLSTGLEKAVQDYIGDILSYDAQQKTAMVRMRNHFETGERAEILSPDQPPVPFEVPWMKDPDGNPVSTANLPMQVLTVPLPYEAKPGDYLRRAYQDE